MVLGRLSIQDLIVPEKRTFLLGSVPIESIFASPLCSRVENEVIFSGTLASCTSRLPFEKAKSCKSRWGANTSSSQPVSQAKARVVPHVRFVPVTRIPSLAFHSPLCPGTRARRGGGETLATFISDADLLSSLFLLSFRSCHTRTRPFVSDCVPYLSVFTG